ncbi:MAG: hypothetical protein AAF989_06480 [Planctomycetota bacterium]
MRYSLLIAFAFLICLPMVGAQEPDANESDSHSAELLESGIRFGGELPVPTGEKDPSFEEEPAEETDSEPNEATSLESPESIGSRTVIQAAMSDLVDAIQGVPGGLDNEVVTPLGIEELATAVSTMDSLDSQSVRQVSRRAHELNRALQRRLRAGLPSDVFASMQDARDILTSKLLPALQPLEEDHSITPRYSGETIEGSAPMRDEDVARGRVLSRPPLPGDHRSFTVPGAPPVTAYRPALPTESLGYRGPGFELRLDLSPPGYGRFGYDDRYRSYQGRVPSAGYPHGLERYGYRPFPYSSPLDGGYRSVPYGSYFRYESYGIPGLGFGAWGGVPVFPYGPVPGYLGIPILPYGLH